VITARTADELIAMLGRRNADALDLARLASFAVRIEPELLRALRLELLRGVDVGAEADVWFSPLVEARDPTAIVLIPEVAAKLRTSVSPAPACAIIKRVHRRAPEILCIEEDLVACAFEPGGASDLEALLQSVLRAMLTEPARRSNLAAWALRALPRLPPAVRESRAFWMLLFAANASLKGQLLPIDGEPRSDLVRDVPPELLDGVGTTAIEVERRGDLLRMRMAQEGATQTIPVPALLPLVVLVSSSRPERAVMIPARGWAEAEAEGDTVTVTSIDGSISTLTALASAGHARATRWRFNGHWVQIAGTGAESLSEAEHWATRAVAEALADAGFGLIGGGWEGVDAVAAEAYSQALRARDVADDSTLLQIVSRDRPSRVSRGRALLVDERSTYDVPLERASAVVLIGGRGATFVNYLRARELGKIVAPLPSTGGDAAEAHRHMLSELPSREFEDHGLRDQLASLDMPCTNEAQARELASRVIQLLPGNGAPPRTSLIALGPELVVEGHIFPMSEERWRVTLVDPTRDEIDRVSQFARDLADLPPHDRFILDADEGEGRFLRESMTRVEDEAVTFETMVQGPAPRETAHGTDAARMISEIAASALGSSLEASLRRRSSQPRARARFVDVLKLEVARIASLPAATSTTGVPVLPNVERVLRVRATRAEGATPALDLKLLLDVHGLGPLEASVFVPVSPEVVSMLDATESPSPPAPAALEKAERAIVRDAVVGMGATARDLQVIGRALFEDTVPDDPFAAVDQLIDRAGAEGRMVDLVLALLSGPLSPARLALRSGPLTPNRRSPEPHSYARTLFPIFERLDPHGASLIHRHPEVTRVLASVDPSASTLRGRLSSIQSVVNATESTLSASVWQTRVVHAVRALCRIDAIGSRGEEVRGSGFLVGPDLVLTCAHVIRGLARGDMRFRFDDFGIPGAPPPVDFGLRGEGWQVDVTSPDEPGLDFALLRLDGSPGHRYEGTDGTWIDLTASRGDPRFRSIAWIPGFGQDRSMHVECATLALQDTAPSSGEIHYFVNEARVGSSGAPVLDRDMRLLGIHRMAYTTTAEPWSLMSASAVSAEAIASHLSRRGHLDLLRTQRG
jgi:V8-like Glu-specific endopeptidase